MWRLSFRAPTKKLKKLWLEYQSILDDYLDPVKLRGLLALLDSIMSSTLSKQQLEELMEDIDGILRCFMETLELVLRLKRDNVESEIQQPRPSHSSNNPSLFAEDGIDMYEDIATKILTSIEVFFGMSDKLYNVCIANPRMSVWVLNALEHAVNHNQITRLIAIMSQLVFSYSSVADCGAFFKRLLAITRKVEMHMVTVEMLLLIATIYKKYSHYEGFESPNSIRRGVSSEVTGGSNSTSRAALSYTSKDKEKAPSANDDNISLAAKGLNLAVNVLGEFLKLTPIARSWGRQEDLLSKDRESSEEEQLSQIEMMAVPVDVLRDEFDRLELILNSSALDSKLEMNDEEFRNRVLFLQAETGLGRVDDTQPTSNSSNIEAMPILRVYLVGQGILDLVLDSLKLETLSRIQALDVIDFVRLLLRQTGAAQAIFAQLGGYEVIAKMLERLETRDLGCSADLTNEGRFGGVSGFFPGDFTVDEYHQCLLQLLLEIINDENVSAVPGIQKQPSVGNVNALLLVKALAVSRVSSLVLIAVRIAFILLKSSPNHIAAFERLGIVEAFSLCMVTLILPRSMHKSSRDKEGLHFHEIDIAKSFVDSLEASIYPFVDIDHQHAVDVDAAATNYLNLLLDVSLLVQYFGVALSCRDISILSLFMALITMVSVFGPSNKLSKSDFQSPPATDLYPSDCKCMNCEDESVVECLHESCLKDVKFRLCRECDRVFHKSQTKKSHIRITYDRNRASSSMHLFRQYSSDSTSRSLDLMEIEKSSGCRLGGCLYGKYDTKDQLLTVLLQRVRGLLDDRRSRNQCIPLEFLDRLIISLRQVTICPPTPFRHPLELTRIVDLRSDIFSTKSDWVHSLDPSCENQPPEIYSSTPRRNCIVLFVHCISRFFVIDKSTPIIRSSAACSQGELLGCLRVELLKVVCSFRELGGDALLTHFLVSDAPKDDAYVQLTLADRQFVIWTIRECIVLAISVGSNDAGDILRWLIWLLHGRISDAKDVSMHSVSSDSGNRTLSQLVSNLQANTSMNVRNSFTDIPSVNPAIQLSTRFCILQELRVLVGGADWIPRSNYLGNAVLHEIPVFTYHGGSNGQKQSRQNSFDRDSGGSTPQHPRSAVQGGSSSPVSLGRICGSSLPIKQLLDQLGIVQTLVGILFGDLCSPRMQKVVSLEFAVTPTEMPDNIDTSSAGQSDSTCELDLEEWLCAFVFLVQLMSNCDEVKSSLDAIQGGKHILNILVPVLSALSNVTSNDWHLGGTIAINALSCTLLNQVVMEYCVGSGRVLPLHRPFLSVSFTTPSSYPVSNGINDRVALSTLIRQIVTNLRVSLECCDADDLIAHPVICQLAPLYFMKLRTGIQVASCMQPMPLACSIDSLGKAIPIAKYFPPSFVPSQPSSVANFNLWKSYWPTQPDSLDSLKASSPGDLASFDAGMNVPVNRRRSASLLSKLSATSLQTLEIGEAWDNESIGPTPSIQSGTHSYHSIQLIAASLSAPRSATPSLLGEVLTRKANQSTRVLTVDSPLLVANTHSFDELDYGQSEAIGYTQPMVYFPNLDCVHESFQEFAGKYVLLLHDTILYKAGLWSGDDLCDDDDGNTDGPNYILTSTLSSFSISDGAQHIQSPSKHTDKHRGETFERKQNSIKALKQHLLPFLPVTRNISSSASSAWPESWSPQYSKLILRTEYCVELLLASCFALKGKAQSQLISFLSRMLEGNPHSHEKFRGPIISKLMDLIQLVDDPRVQLFYVFSQLIRHSVNSEILERILRLVCSVRNEDIVPLIASFTRLPITGVVQDASDDTSDCANQLLFSLGRAANRVCPSSYLHFNMESPLRGGLLLPPIQPSTEKPTGITVCCWLRVGSIGPKSIATLFQIRSTAGFADALTEKPTDSENCCVTIDAFFRTVVKRTNPVRDNDNVSVSSGTSTFPGDGIGADESTKRNLQLCLSFSNANDLSPARQTEQATAMYPTSETRSSRDISLDKHKSKLSEWANIVTRVVDGDIANHSTPLLVSSSEASNAQNVDQDVLSLVSALAKFSLPDFVVEYDWSDESAWHLLSLTFSDQIISCTIDGTKAPILIWTKSGYMHTDFQDNIGIAASGTSSTIPVRAARTPLAPFSNLPSSEQLPKGGNFKAPEKISAVSENPFGIRFPYNTSRKTPLVISFGAQGNEASSAERLISLMHRGHDGGDSASTLVVEAILAEISSIVHSYESLISGFIGCLGDIHVIEGVVDDSSMATCFSEGCDAGFSSVKMKRIMSCLPSTIHPSPIQEFRQNNAFTSTVIKSTPSEVSQSSFFTLFGSQSVSSVPILATGKDVGDEKVLGPELLGGVSVCHTLSVTASMKPLGGLRVFCPLLLSERTRHIASLRVLQDIALSSPSTYAEYLGANIDKIILYCCYIAPQLTCSETLQIVFDSVCLTNSIGEVITRPTMMSLAVDISLSCPSRPHLARATMDWLRNICDDNAHNNSKALDNIGIASVLLFLSIWGIRENLQEQDLRFAEGLQQFSSICPLSTFSLPPSERENTIQERWRLQLSCGMLLRQFMTGTSGQHQQLDCLPPPTAITTSSGFNCTHLANILQFAQHCVRSYCEDSKLVGSRPFNPSCWYFKRPDGARKGQLMNVLSSGNNSMQSRFNLSSDQQINWQLTAAILALDSVISAATGPLGPVINNMLRLVFPNGGIWYLLLHLMGAPILDIRARALKLLSLAFTAIPGTLDGKSVTAFEKIHGFSHMADQLSNYPLEDVITDLLLGILFWRFPVYVTASKLADRTPTHKPGIASADTVSGTNCSPLLSSNGNASNSTTPAGSILSLFSWRNAMSTTPIAPTTPATSTSLGVPVAFGRPSSEEQVVDQTLFDSISDIGLGVSSTVRAQTVAPSNSLMSCSLASINGKSPARASLANIAIGVGGGINDATRAPTEYPQPAVGNSHDQRHGLPREELNGKRFYGRSPVLEVIHVPQILVPLFKCLQRAANCDLVVQAVQQIEMSVVSPTLEDFLGSNSLKGMQSSGSNSSQLRIEHLVVNAKAVIERNAESIFSQKDWLIGICECVLAYRRKIMKRFGAEEDETLTYETILENRQTNFSPTDSDSLHQLSEIASEDDEKDSLEYGHRVYSVTDSQVDGSESGYSSQSHSASGVHSFSLRTNKEQLEELVAQYADPLLSLVESLLSFDMRQKPQTSGRRWMEIFRLSTPDTAHLQEWILFNSLRMFECFPLDCKTYSLETVTNYLRNSAMLLEHCLDKMDLSLDFCVRAIQVLHALNYKCPPEVRARLKDSGLTEMRNAYIVRCLLVCFHGDAGDLFVRCLALSLIHSPLQGYITLTESKILQGQHILLYILSLFLEATDELEAVSLSSATEVFREADRSQLLDRANALIDAIHMLVAIVQSLVAFSPECRRCMTKLAVKLPEDPDDCLLQIFLGSHSPPIHTMYGRTAVESSGDSVRNFEKIDSNKPLIIFPPNVSVGSSSATRVPSVASSPTTAAVNVSSGSWWSGWLQTNDSLNQSKHGNQPHCGPTPHSSEFLNFQAQSSDDDQTLTIEHVARAPFLAINSDQNFTSGEENSMRTTCEDSAHNGTPDPTCVRETDAQRSSEGNRLNYISKFLTWYCTPANRKLQIEFKNRLHREFNQILKQMERLHDKTKKRQSIHDSTVQDRISREKSAHEKIVKEVRDKLSTVADRCNLGWSGEAKGLLDALASRIEKGRTDLNMHLQSVIAARSTEDLNVYSNRIDPRLLDSVRQYVLANASSGQTPASLIDSSNMFSILQDIFLERSI